LFLSLGVTEKGTAQPHQIASPVERSGDGTAAASSLDSVLGSFIWDNIHRLLLRASKASIVLFLCIEAFEASFDFSTLAAAAK